MRRFWFISASAHFMFLNLATPDDHTCGVSHTPSLLQQRFQTHEARMVMESSAVCDGVTAVGRCWYMSDVGANCDTTCAVHGFKYSYAYPTEDMTPLLLGSRPSLRQEPWLFVECYVPNEDRYHPSNPNAWGVPQKTPVSELPEVGRHTYASCSLACPCSTTPLEQPIQYPDLSPAAQVPYMPVILPGTRCSDGLGFDSVGRCWYLSDAGASCDDTCQAHGTSYFFAIPDEDMVPKLLGHQPIGKQEPWIFLECYAPREDRYHTVNSEAWGVPGYTPSNELAEAGQYSYPTCRLSCPCKKISVAEASRVTPPPLGRIELPSTSSVAVVPTLAPQSVVVGPLCTDGVGLAFEKRCWYLSETGASCAATCASHDRSYSFAAPIEDMVPKLLGRKPSARQEPWIFLECYVQKEDRYHPFKPEAWGVPENTPAEELTETSLHSYPTCRLACPCSQSLTSESSPPPSAPPSATTTTTTTTVIDQTPQENDVRTCSGILASGRCWYLSDLGTSCDQTCASHSCSYSFSPPPAGDMVPSLLKKVPYSRQNPWLFVECYVPESDAYYPFNRDAWGVPDKTPANDINRAGKQSYDTCRLSCPCQGTCVGDVSTSTPKPEPEPEPEPEPPRKIPEGVEAYGRKWYLSKVGQNCADTCATKGLSYKWAAPPEGKSIMPQLLGKELSIKQSPWSFVECYVPEDDRYLPVSTSAWGVPGRKPYSAKKASLWSAAECRLACPCGTVGKQCSWEKPSACAQEFEWKGQLYGGCATVDNEKPWCMHNREMTGPSGWSECLYTCDEKVQEAPVQNCDWTPSATCVKEFDYEGSHYVGCIDVDHNSPWCSNSQKFSGSWSHCTYTCSNPSEVDTNMMTTLNQDAAKDDNLCTWQPPLACSSKFEYMGIEYEGCAMWVGHPTPWCSHDRSHAGNWSNCERVCTSSA